MIRFCCKNVLVNRSTNNPKLIDPSYRVYVILPAVLIKGYKQSNRLFSFEKLVFGILVFQKFSMC